MIAVNVPTAAHFVLAQTKRAANTAIPSNIGDNIWLVVATTSCIKRIEILKSVIYVNVHILEQTLTTAAGVSVDKIDLHILSLLYADCRTPYRSIASTVGLSANAVKTRVKKMISTGIIKKFIVKVNPAIFGYQKQCFLVVRNSDKIITKEKDYVFNQLNLLGDVLGYAKQLGGDTIFLLLVRPEAEEKIEFVTNLLKPATIEYRFATINPPSMNVSISDLKIIKCLLSNARMEIADIAKEA
jgi:DNA-binding Lrp family transcriptional regulator